MMDASLPSLTGIQVLVVDDHQDIRDLIEQVPTPAGRLVGRETLAAWWTTSTSSRPLKGERKCPRSLGF